MTMSRTHTAFSQNTLVRGQALLARLLATPPDSAAAVARVTLGLVLFPHGAQHALGWNNEK